MLDLRERLDKLPDKPGVYIMKNKKKLGLTTLIFIALIAGAITGIIINYFIILDKQNKFN